MSEPITVATPIATDGTTVVDRYVKSTLEKKAAQAIVKQLEAEVKELETQAKVFIKAHGATAARTANGYEVEIGTMLWARAEEGQTPSIVASLIARSMGQFVTYNIASLSALFRRMRAEGLALPKIKGMRIDDDETISVRKAK